MIVARLVDDPFELVVERRNTHLVVLFGGQEYPVKSDKLLQFAQDLLEVTKKFQQDCKMISDLFFLK